MSDGELSRSSMASPTGANDEGEIVSAPQSPENGPMSPGEQNSVSNEGSPIQASSQDDNGSEQPSHSFAHEQGGNSASGSPVKHDEIESDETAHNEKEEDDRPTTPKSGRSSAQGTPQRREAIDSEDEDEDTPHKKKNKRLVDSDDEGDEEEEESSPVKRRVLVSSDEDSDGETERVSKKRVRDTEDEDDLEDDLVGKTSKKRLLGSDVSDDSDDGGDGDGKDKDVGELMANIFGDDSDEEGAEKGERPEQEDQEDRDPEGEPEYTRERDEIDDNGMEWDFDVMLRQKKAERSKTKKKRRGDGGIDIINDDDGVIAHLVEAMKAATKDDRHANSERRPALKKRKMLHEVRIMLLRSEMYEAMIDNGMMSAVSDWLSPLPDKSLPALEIRTDLLKSLQSFARIDQSVLKQSGLGKAVMMLFKHPKETKANRDMAAKLIREWSRPIFQLDTDYRTLTREERENRDLEHSQASRKRRSSQDEGPSSSQQKDGLLEPGAKNPNEKGWVPRARVPRPSTKDYVHRPKSNVEGAFKGERKATKFNRLDKTQREFMDRTKRLKARRAVNVSLEGRNLAI